MISFCLINSILLDEKHETILNFINEVVSKGQLLEKPHYLGPISLKFQDGQSLRSNRHIIHRGLDELIAR